jgi:hypothetical protein
MGISHMKIPNLGDLTVTSTLLNLEQNLKLLNASLEVATGLRIFVS